uniref:Rhs family protein n=1 Tax=Heterorhabditis bacteriophora TaxID=37862 RepID=A0A1I7WV25_HETBA
MKYHEKHIWTKQIESEQETHYTYASRGRYISANGREVGEENEKKEKLTNIQQKKNRNVQRDGMRRCV